MSDAAVPASPADDLSAYQGDHDRVAAGSPISVELAAFMQSGISVTLAVVTADLRPIAGFALACRVDGHGRVVTYCGDGGHLYKLVANHAGQPDRLDDGTLHVAHFSADGEEDWMPVAFGAAPLVMENGTLTWMPVAARPADIRTGTRRPTRLDGIRDGSWPRWCEAEWRDRAARARQSGDVSGAAVRAFEPRVGLAKGPGLGYPDAHFLFVDSLLVFDNVSRTIKVVAHLNLDLHPDVETAYAVAASRTGRVALSPVMLPPNWPDSWLPQAYTVPSCVSARLWQHPAAIATTWLSPLTWTGWLTWHDTGRQRRPSPIRPQDVHPQAHTVPSDFSARLW